jgi:hypothetical protein
MNFEKSLPGSLPRLLDQTIKSFTQIRPFYLRLTAQLNEYRGTL